MWEYGLKMKRLFKNKFLIFFKVKKKAQNRENI